MTKYFSLLILLALLILGIMIYALLQLDSFGILPSILLIIAIILTFVLLKLYEQFSYYKHQYILTGMLENKQEPRKINITALTTNFINNLTQNLNYTLHQATSSFSSYYKIDRGLTKRRTHKTLFVVLVFNKNISFIDQKSTIAFENLEKSLPKKEKYSQRIFIQIKKTEKKFTDADIEDTDKIFFLNQRRMNIVVLNALYSIDQQQVYYLYSDKIKLPSYLNIAYQELNKIIT